MVVMRGFCTLAMLLLWLMLLDVALATDFYSNCGTSTNNVINAQSGTLSAPTNDSDYQQGSFQVTQHICNFQISDSSNKDVLFFRVTHLNIASSASGQCDTDRFILSKWPDTSETWADICHTITTPTVYRGTSNQGLISFLDNIPFPDDPAFSVDWYFAPICSGGYYEVTNTFLKSFTWEWYNGSPDCEYLFSAPGKYVRITISEFVAAAGNADCTGDYIEIANANDTAEIWHKICTAVNSDIYLDGAGSYALLKYHRTQQGQTYGFQASWESSDYKGMTLAERESMYMWLGIGGGLGVVLMVIAICVLRRCVKNRKSKKTAVSSVKIEPAQGRKVEVKKKKDKTPALPHIMISYQWNVKPEVKKFRQKLDEAGYRVWIDIEQMHKNTSTFDAMTDAIEMAAVVVPVLTAAYQESVNCRKEIEYADKSKKPIVPVRFEKKFKPTKWLSFLLGNALWHDLSDPETYEIQFTNFMEALSKAGESAKRKEEEEWEDTGEGKEATNSPGIQQNAARFF